MKKPILVIILILVAAALVAGGIAIGFAISSNSSSPSGTSATSGTSGTGTVANVDPIVGKWAGEKSIIFVGSLKVNAVFTDDGKAVLSGSVNSSLIGDYDASIDATWKRTGTTTYQLSAYDYSIEFTCDGKTISYTFNPYELGLVDNSMADIDLTLTLSKVK